MFIATDYNFHITGDGTGQEFVIIGVVTNLLRKRMRNTEFSILLEQSKDNLQINQGMIFCQKVGNPIILFENIDRQYKRQCFRPPCAENLIGAAR